jgi:hypothetical protein
MRAGGSVEVEGGVDCCCEGGFLRGHIDVSLVFTRRMPVSK